MELPPRPRYSPTMNYRHAFHAGNFADVVKHAILALCLDHLGSKDKPYRVIDTHAGIGAYDLTSDEAARSPEWVDGIGRIIGADMPDDVAAALKPYLDYARDGRVKVEHRDGYKALTGLVPPKEKRGLVLIDPPFEDRDELAHLAEAVMPALKKWPIGTYVFWRSLKNLWAADRFDNGLTEWLITEQGFEPEKILRADLWIRDLASDGKLSGAGVIIINPPWQLEEKLLALLPWLAETLAQGDGYGWRLDGGLTEEDVEEAEDD